jgi:hypothetical protein
MAPRQARQYSADLGIVFVCIVFEVDTDWIVSEQNSRSFIKEGPKSSLDHASPPPRKARLDSTGERPTFAHETPINGLIFSSWADQSFSSLIGFASWLNWRDTGSRVVSSGSAQYYQSRRVLSGYQAERFEHFTFLMRLACV